MTTLTAIVRFEDKDHDQARVAVQTTRCWYQVAIRGLEVIVVGPGIEETYDFAACAEEYKFFDCMTFKGRALIAVAMLEETE